MKSTVCFGEIMARFSPSGRWRFLQSMPGTMDVTFAGAEANAAVTVARLGGKAEFVTALPTNPVAKAAEAVLRAAGVGLDLIVREDAGRVGIYFVEAGANQRGGLVIYDRENSVFAQTPPGKYPWDRIFAGAGWLHTTGISAGVSKIAADSTEAAVRAARQGGITVSCDLNFRRKLWRWSPGIAPAQLAQQTLRSWIDAVDVLISNPYDLAALVGEDFSGDPSDVEACGQLALRVATRLPTLRWIAMTLRQNGSASRNLWGALLLRPASGEMFAAPMRGEKYEPYLIDTIVDRVGTGDAFAGALIYALQDPELCDPAKAIAFATAAGCLAHSVQGDFFQSSLDEVIELMNGNDAGHISR